MVRMWVDKVRCVVLGQETVMYHYVWGERQRERETETEKCFPFFPPCRLSVDKG